MYSCGHQDKSRKKNGMKADLLDAWEGSSLIDDMAS